MRVGSAAGLDRCNLLWILEVGNVEDSDAAETVLLRYRDVALFFFASVVFVVSVDFILILNLIFIFVFFLVCGWSRFRRKSLNAAIQTSIGHLYGHEHQIFVNGHIPLSTRANYR